MSSRDNYNSAVKTAVTTQVASAISAESAKQEAINASGCNVGYNLQTGNYANFAAGVKAANTARVATLNAAEAVKQTAITAARDTLKATGDLAPT